MSVTLGMLTVCEETLWHHEVKIVLCTRHRDVKQAALLLELSGSASAEVRRHATVDHVEDIDRLPFLALRRMDRRQDEVVLIQERHAGLIAGRVRRVQGEFRQEAFARSIPARDLFELNEIGTPNLGVFADAL